MIILVDYASPSMFESTRDAASLAFSTNARRPVRFHGVVRRHGFNLRIALRALGEAIWPNDSWFTGTHLLDPFITVHPDRIFFEAFSHDQSVYVALIVDPSIFETEGDIVTGTTNFDLKARLWSTLDEMRTGRRTSFRIGPERFEVAGGRFERKVDIPESWVRGFLKVQAAMAMPGTRLDVQPVDLLAAVRFLRYNKAEMSHRALRYVFDPGHDARLVLEPWEQVVPLVGAVHDYAESKVTRVWGQRRLKLIEGLLPFADSVQVYLKGRALPSFYAVKLAGMTFVLGLSGFSEASFTGTSGFDLQGFDLQDTLAAEDDALLDPTLDLLRREFHQSMPEIAAALGLNASQATRLLVRLCRQGQCMFDVESRRYRFRDLFELPADELKYFPPDRRRELAERLIAEGRVRVETCSTSETTKTRRLKTPDGPVRRQITYRDWHIRGAVGEILEVEVVVNDSGSIILGRCSCPFFDANLMRQGPCEHILALFQATASQRVDQPTSVPATDP